VCYLSHASYSDYRLLAKVCFIGMRLMLQLIFLLGLPLLYFYVFSDHATKYVMLPVTIYQYVRTRMPKSGLKMFGTMSSTTPGRADPGEKTPLLGTGEEVPMKNYKSLENRREML
jgi:hypothetical protein